MAAKKGIKITPAQMMQQWVHAQHRFQINLWNFEIQAGNAAVEVFRGSFDLGRLNSNDARPWAERKRKYRHPILNETGTLMNSIEWKFIDMGVGPKKGVRVFTNPNKFGTAKRHAGFCYAAVHNAADSSFRTGKVANMPQRQFIGHSSVLDKRLRMLVPTIFIGMP